MGKRQGVKWLKRGIVRPLAPHEVERGYIFISKDKGLHEILDFMGFEVDIAQQIFSSRKIDRHGRIQIPRSVLRDIGTKRKLCISLVSRKKIKITLS